jgi:hypothetical protein
MYAYTEARRQIEHLVEQALSGADDMQLVKGMKEIVPEFKSQHSVYEALDDDSENKERE